MCAYIKIYTYTNIHLYVCGFFLGSPKDVLESFRTSKDLTVTSAFTLCSLGSWISYLRKPSFNILRVSHAAEQLLALRSYFEFAAI